MTASTMAVFLVVAGARFLVPLLIPRFPLPAIVAALVLDAVDQTVFQSFGYDPPGYQGYDKAMDVYYLAIAYLATMRNWTSQPAIRIARFLYFYRLVGVLCFELTDWRPLLLIFPNTFEYFFIAYEILRLGWDPARRSARFWVVTTASIWIFVKLPQEWWIHIARLDVTDLLGEMPWLGPVVAAAAVVLGVVAWLVARPHVPARDWSWRVAAERLPLAMDSADERDEWIAANGRLRSVATIEKVVLVGFLSVIFAKVLPSREATFAGLFFSVAVFVVLNAAISLWFARESRSTESVLVTFGLRTLINVGLMLAGWQMGGGGDLNYVNAFFFILLLSLITLLDDRYRPVYGARFPQARPAGLREAVAEPGISR
ncbi:hypothetical protein GCM10022251_77070 [Phytohabitans flavus]|uniref:Uncharacterized protein n=1 Tax=Phytohabitans flavus TaxID=1076124 RepID=A0A6F8XLM6_9ACTN|nr:hypothetical protein [Phytohabitans flavus]BCB74720.1 hypothetical protein Pflav_011300 [Phytohabitans flavus]